MNGSTTHAQARQGGGGGGVGLLPPTEQHQTSNHRRTRSSTSSTVTRTISPEVTTTRRSTRRRRGGMPPPSETAVDLTSTQASTTSITSSSSSSALDAQATSERPAKRARHGSHQPPNTSTTSSTRNQQTLPSISSITSFPGTTTNTQELAAINLTEENETADDAALSDDNMKPEIEEINLINVDDVDGLNELLAKSQKDLLSTQNSEGRQKLSGFKCVICLDDPTDLAATPCGHMFCDFCLRGALRAGQPPNAKSGRCPVCRRKVNLKDVVVLEIMKKAISQNKGKAKAS